jgi:hypothetical protein
MLGSQADGTTGLLHNQPHELLLHSSTRKIREEQTGGGAETRLGATRMRDKSRLPARLREP